MDISQMLTGIKVAGASPTLDLLENDQTDPAGRWRWQVQGDVAYLKRATGAMWSTEENWIVCDKANSKITLLYQEVIGDDTLFSLGTNSDQVMLNRSTSLNANTALGGVLVGTPVTPAIAANSLIVSNVTTDGDILMAGSDGGNSTGFLFFDASSPDLILYKVGGTWTAGATTWTIPAVTLSGAVAGGDQSFTNVGDMTFAAGSILASGSTNTNTLLIRANDTTFITLTTGATDTLDIGAHTISGTVAVNDDVLFTLGTNNDDVLAHRSSALAANTTLTGVVVGTPVTRATAADSLIVSNITSNGDIHFIFNKGGNSQSALLLDGSAGFVEIASDLYGADNVHIYLGTSSDINIFHDGTNSYITNNTGALLLTFSTAELARFASGAVTFNEGAADVDYRFEGDNNANMLVIDGGYDNMAFGTAINTGSFLAIDASAVNRAMTTATGYIINCTNQTLTFTNPDPTTIATCVGIRIGAFTLAGANPNQSYTDASAMILLQPVAGANATITRAWALYCSTGGIYTAAGINIGNNSSTNNLFDDASNGAGSTAMYIGNGQIALVSDIRLKTDINPTIINALDVLGRLHVIDHQWDDPTDRNPYGKNFRGRWTGISAQELLQTIPYVVNTNGGTSPKDSRTCPECLGGYSCEKHGVMTVNYEYLVPVLVKAIQELSAEIERLKTLCAG